MKKRIEKNIAKGEIFAPASKSVAHRMLIAAALCQGQKSVIRGLTSCEDVLATIDCIKALGVKIEYSDSCAEVWGIDMSKTIGGELFCRESGSTLRFITPLLWLSGDEFSLSGSKRLFERPMSVYDEISATRDIVFKKYPEKIITKGRLCGGSFNVRGDVSSQFITGLLFALSTLDEDSEINITTHIESRDYIDITLDVMRKFGVEAVWKDSHTLSIRGGQKYSAVDLTVEGDWSNSAFLDAFNYLDGDVNVLGLNPHSYQGDKIYRDHMKTLNDGFAEINLEDCPDLAPILFTLAAIKNGGKFIGAGRLKIKESDRAEVMKEELSKFGAEIIIEENTVSVNKAELHTPTDILFGHNDHRIVMSLAVICSVYGGEIEGCEAVNKSYPDFFKNISSLGIHAYETH